MLHELARPAFFASLAMITASDLSAVASGDLAGFTHGPIGGGGSILSRRNPRGYLDFKVEARKPSDSYRGGVGIWVWGNFSVFTAMTVPICFSGSVWNDVKSIMSFRGRCSARNAE